MSKLNARRLIRADFDKPCKELSIYLLGKTLVRKLENGIILKGQIVETEAYLGGEDKGSHSYNNRRTATNEPMYMPAGTAYVYITYGMYHCINVSSKEPGAAVLLRALEPISGTEMMENFRVQKLKTGKKVMKTCKLCDGPSKLCISMNITRSNTNKIDLTDPINNEIWLEDDPSHDKNDLRVVHSSRIGIASAGVEWATKPLRFYILNNDCVSRRDKAAEDELNYEFD